MEWKPQKAELERKNKKETFFAAISRATDDVDVSERVVMWKIQVSRKIARHGYDRCLVSGFQDRNENYVHEERDSELSHCKNM